MSFDHIPRCDGSASTSVFRRYEVFIKIFNNCDFPWNLVNEHTIYGFPHRRNDAPE